MAGSLLGPDQIRKINLAFPTLVAHIRSLLVADHSGVGLMRVHSMVESFDSDEMARIFRELSYISPMEKKALVRAAIYELMATDAELFVQPLTSIVVTGAIAPSVLAKPEEAKIFTPPQFKLNVATTGAEEIAKTDTKPTPVVTSTHTPIVAERLIVGDKAQIEQKTKLEAAVAKLQQSSRPIEIMSAPEDVNLQETEPAEPAIDSPTVAE